MASRNGCTSIDQKRMNAFAYDGVRAKRMSATQTAPVIASDDRRVARERFVAVDQPVERERREHRQRHDGEDEKLLRIPERREEAHVVHQLQKRRVTADRARENRHRSRRTAIVQPRRRSNSAESASAAVSSPG